MDALSTQISSRSFDTVRRGYDPRAVDSYLAKLGEQVAKIEDELRVVRSKLETVEKQTQNIRDADTIVKTAFLAAAESKAKLIAEAETTAAEIIGAAEDKAQGIAAGAEAGDEREEAMAMLREARRRLEESERQAVARREEAELEAQAIITAARTRIETGGAPLEEGVTAAAKELTHLVDELAALREAAMQGLGQTASLESEIAAVVGSQSLEDQPDRATT